MLGIAIAYFRDYSLKMLSFLGIFLLYTLALLFFIYDKELGLQFNHSFIQSRYMFSVIDIAFIFTAIFVNVIPRKNIRFLTLIVILAVYIITGPLTFVLKFSSVFADWLII